MPSLSGDANTTIDDILVLFKEEILSKPYLGKELTIETDYADINGFPNVTLEASIDYNMTQLLNEQEGKISKEISELRGYYNQIKRMAIDESVLVNFNRILKKSLLTGKEEQFTNFPSRQIFLKFYTLFTQML
jgi:hypothetical protein